MTVKEIYPDPYSYAIVTFYNGDGTTVDFSNLTGFKAEFRESDVIADYADDNSLFDWTLGSGKVRFNFGKLTIDKGTYSAKITVIDASHPDGQILVEYEDGLKFDFLAENAIDLVPQDDSGTETAANSYVTLTYFKTYHKMRGNDFSGYDDYEIKAAIVKAFDFLEVRFRYVSSESTDEQNSKWPRYGFPVIPQAIKDAQCEYALRSLSAELNPDPTHLENGRVVKSKSSGVTGAVSESITYADGYESFSIPEYPNADLKLKRAGLIMSDGSGFLIRG